MAFLARDEMIEVKKMKWKDGNHREILPIDKHLEKMLDLLKGNQVVIVEAETGAGKTTRIPQAILTKWPDEKIFVTQPRRPAVRANGRRVSYEMQTRPGGDLVGWKLFGESPMVSRNTRCVFRVDQAMANLIRRTGQLPKGVIIVDEAHERNVPIDTLLIMLGEMLPNFPETRLIVTSATIDTKKFSEYFDNAPIMSVEGRCYPVETLPRALAKHEHHTGGAISAAKDVIQKFLNGELTIQNKDDPESRITVSRGTVLVLLPGKEDINRAISSLKSFVDRTKENFSVEAITLETKKIADSEYKIEIFAQHSEISAKEQDCSMAEVPKGTLRVVCATDIARSSLTFPRVIGVIDSLQVKRPFTDHKGVAQLDKIPVSRAEADQARGRAGRTQCGFYIPIGSEYETLQKYPTPAILREPLPGVVLQLIAAGINPRSCQYIDAPDPEKISAAIERLVKIGALDEEEQITEIGKLLIQFPLDPEQARILITADQLGVLSEAVIATACVNNEGIFFLPRRDAEVVIEERIVEFIFDKMDNDNYSLDNLPSWIKKEGNYYSIDAWDYNWREGARAIAGIVRANWSKSESDFAAMVEAYRAYKQKSFELRDEAKFLGHNYKWTENELFAWCQRNFLNLKKLRLVEQTIRQIKEVLQSSPLQLQNGIVTIHPFDADALTKSIASGLIDNIGRRRDGNQYKSPMGDFQKANTSACSDEEDLILIGGLRKIPYSRRGRTYHFLLADLAAPIKAEWLEEIMPQFCESSEVDEIKYDSTEDKVFGILHIEFNNEEIATRKVEVTDERAVPIFAAALASGKVDLPCADQNKAVREQSRQLRVRSGGTVEEISEADEQKLYEAEFTDKGITSAQSLQSAIESGEINPDNLLLKLEDFIPAETQEKIMADNPDTVKVEGETLTIEYGGGSWGDEFYCRAEVTEEFARSVAMEVETVTLPGSRTVELRCDGHRAESFPELVEKLEQERIERAWSKKRSELESSSWISNPEEVFPRLSELLTAVEITREDNGQGEPILGFFSLYSDSDLDFKIKIRESEKEAEKETKVALERLFRKATREFRRIPSEEPWNNSELREALKNRLDALLQEHYENLTLENIQDQIELIKTEIEKAKAEIGGQHAEAQQLVEKTKMEVNAKIDEVDNEFVETEISQAREEIQKAKDYLKSAAYGDVKATCEMAVELAGQLAELAEIRSQGKREAEAAREEVSDDLYNLEYGYEDYDSAISDERAEAGRISEEISDTFFSRRYEIVLEKVEEARKLIAQVRERHTRIEMLLKSEYAVCPVCGGSELENHYWCSDRGQQILLARGESEIKIKVSRIGDQELILLIAEYDSDYDEFRMRIEVNSQILAENPDAEIETEILWREPSAAERKVVSEIFELKRKLEYIEDERARGGRVEITFSEKQGPKGKSQLQGEGVFTGGVDNRKADDGWSEYKNQPTIFVCRDNCPWLDDQPADGETWICTIAFQIAMNKGKPVIVVNPQARSDIESEIQEEIAGLERELSIEKER